MSLTGNISTMSLAEIFQWLNSGLKTGTLHVRGADGIEKEVYFEDGVINSASSNDPRELIGQFLLNCNKINERQLTDALEEQKRDHVLLGKVLVRQNLLTEEELHNILCTISEEVIYDLFLWKEGEFEFKDGELPNREMPSMKMDITHIVLEGARREDEWSRIKGIFPNENVTLRPNIEIVAEKFPLKPALARLLFLVNGNRTIYEITRLYKSTKFNVCRLLADLFEENLVEVGGMQDQIIHPLSSYKADPVREMSVQIESLLKQGRIEEAENVSQKLLEIAAEDNPEVQVVLEMIEDKKLETTAKRVIRLDAVPEISMDVDAITKMNLSAEEGFLVSRINGSWDVKSIIRVSPFEEALCLKLFKSFMDRGMIRFR
jgi:hypothetical protein